MWSVKCLPKPGSARIASRSAAGVGCSLRVTAQVSPWSAIGSCVVISCLVLVPLGRRQHATGPASPAGTGREPVGRPRPSMSPMHTEPAATRQPIDTVVFDLGGVLIDWDPRHLYRQLFSDPEEMEVFLRDVVSPDWNAEQDSGRTWAEATALLMEQHPQHEDMIRAYVDRWSDMLAGPIEGTVAILSEVRDAGFRIYALTNWSAETFPRARGLFPFLDWFEGIVVSGDERIREAGPGDLAADHRAVRARSGDDRVHRRHAPQRRGRRQPGLQGHPLREPGTAPGAAGRAGGAPGAGGPDAAAVPSAAGAWCSRRPDAWRY